MGKKRVDGKGGKFGR
jgi:hypothetical protein